MHSFNNMFFQQYKRIQLWYNLVFLQMSINEIYCNSIFNVVQNTCKQQIQEQRGITVSFYNSCN